MKIEIHKGNIPIVDYRADTHEIWVDAPTAETHEAVRSVPGARELKSKGRWVMPATPATAARLTVLYGGVMIVTPAYRDYSAAVVRAHERSRTALTGPWRPIPRTRLQPEGEWLHQRRAFWFAQPQEASMLAVTMGGGKTKIAIDLLQEWEARYTLVIAPLVALEDVWGPELAKHMLSRYVVSICSTGSVNQRMTTAERVLALSALHGVVLINWDAFWREPFISWACDRRWDLIIADESHRSKSAGSKCSKALARLGTRARRRLALTGTPMPHSPLDVYGQFRFLDRGIFGMNYDKFEAEYAVYKPGYMGRMEVDTLRNLDDLERKFRTIAITIDDSEQGLPRVVDLPHHTVRLEPAVRRVYDKLDDEFVAQCRVGEITAKNAGAKFVRLQQLACGIAVTEKGTHRIGKSKLDGLLDILEDFEDREPIIIFANFVPDVRAIVDACRKAGRTVSEISGSINQLSEWKAGRTDVLVAQIQTVKESIDLTRSAVGIFYSTGISLGNYQQCRKRLHRPPQKRMVRFVHIIARATRDVDTLRAFNAGKQVIDSVLHSIRGK